MRPLRDRSASDSKPTNPLSRRPRLDALQGLRGFAALFVVVGHSLAIFRGALSGDGNAGPLDIYGALGVTTFFVVSGFLMVYVHGQDFGQPGSTAKFYARRIARIVPLYWAVTIVYAAKQIYFDQASLPQAIKSLLFIPFQTAGELWRPVLGQGWTLNYEMLFYLVFGLALFFSRGVWLVFAAFSTLALLNAFAFFSPHNVFDFWSDPIILYFLAGVLIGLGRARASRGPSFGVALTAALLALSLAAALSELLGPTSIYVSVAMPLAAVCAVMVTAYAREGFRVSLVRRFAKHIGDASYSIYLTHTFVIAPAAKVIVAKMFPTMPVFVFVLLMIAATIIVGYATFRYVERPLIKMWTQAFISRRSAQTTTPAAAD